MIDLWTSERPNGRKISVRRGRAVPPPADLGTGDAKTVEGARKFLA